MSLKSEEDSALKPKELVFLLAIAGRIDAQSRLLAQKLDKDRYIYHAYAILDSLSSSYSMFKYFFEVFNKTSNPDLMRDFLTSPEGIATVTCEVLFLVGFSLLASLYDREKKDAAKKLIATAWPYFRDVMKGLKNAYKGWRSTVQVMGLLSGMDLKYLVLPVGLVLGICAAANRLWLRDMVERRKKQMDDNKELLQTIQKLSPLTLLDREHYLSRIGVQDEDERIHAFMAVAAGGFIDGLYLYAGVTSLSVFAPPLFIALTVLSVFYTLACVVTRIYEEYDFQLRLQITQTRCKFALATKEMEATYAKLLALQEKTNKNSTDLDQIKQLKSDTRTLIQHFEELRQELKDQTTHSYLTAGLLGMKYGLFAYGVLASILFTVSSIFLASGAIFPPGFLAAVIFSGLVFMIGFTAHILNSHHQDVQKQTMENAADQPYSQLLEMKRTLETQDDAEILTAEDFGKALKDGTVVKSSQTYFFQEWFEVFRSLVSGASKGNNFFNFATTPLQDVELDEDTHFVLSILAAASAVLFSVILGLRALAKGLGRPPLGTVPTTTTTTKIELTKLSTDAPKTEQPRESSEPAKKKSPDSPPRNSSFLSLLGLFNTKQNSPSPPQKLIHSKSESSLDKSTNQTTGGTILGLE